MLGRVEASCSVLPPVGEKIFVGSYDFHMYALSAVKGNILWKYKTNDIIKCTPSVTTSFLIFGKIIFIIDINPVENQNTLDL